MNIYHRNTFILSLILLGLFIAFFPIAQATPDKGNCSCHNSMGYSMSTPQDRLIHVEPSKFFTLEIYANGTSGILQIHTDSFDNEKFDIIPSRMIHDNSIFDLDRDEDKIHINLTIKAPKEQGFYKILIYTRSPNEIDGMPSIACITFEIIVGSLTILDYFGWIFDHMNIYLGLGSISLVMISTILYEKDKHSTRSHGILSTISLLLAIINVSLVIESSFEFFADFRPTVIYYWIILIHIFFGGTGLLSGILAMFTGLAGIRTKKPGYIAMVFWIIAFLTGIIFWGVNLR